MSAARPAITVVLSFALLWVAFVMSALVPVVAQPVIQSSPTAPAAIAAANAAHGAIPFKQEKQSTDTLAYQSFAALVLVGLAAYGIVFGLKRFGGFMNGPLGKARRLRTIEAIRLGRRSMLFIVEYKGQELLLVESDQGVQLLTTGPVSILPSAPAGATEAGTTHA